MEKFISVIVPNFNRSSTIGKCLEAVYSSVYEHFEVIVVDDGSTDNSVEIIRQFPCKLIQSEKNSGASAARNTGAKNSSGEVLFFIDSDCLLQKDTLSLVNRVFGGYDPNSTVIGGTYTKIPYDNTFFSTFQSIFINYSETKTTTPDYIPGHALIIGAVLFQKSGGFAEDFLPILEDVEFSHRLRKAGCSLVMSPEIVVRHIFNFTLSKSFKNAFRKSSYWTFYSLVNKDLFKNSGTASTELKSNVASIFFAALFLSAFLIFGNVLLIMPVPLILAVSLWINRKLSLEFYRAAGFYFALKALIYYTLFYPLPVGTGALAGTAKYLVKKT